MSVVTISKFYLYENEENEGNNPEVQLGAVHHSASDVRVLFRDCIKRAAKHIKRKNGQLKGAHEGAKLQLLVDVVLDIRLEQ